MPAADSPLERCRHLIGMLDQVTRQLGSESAGREQLQKERDDLVVELSGLGASRAVVAKLSGLTRGRVQQILTAADAAGPATQQLSDPEVRRMIEEAITARALPSIGVGVRRESPSGPHLGRGWGGAIPLTGDLDEDRAAVVDVLEQLVQAARAGDFDDVLRLSDQERAVVGPAIERVST